MGYASSKRRGCKIMNNFKTLDMYPSKIRNYQSWKIIFFQDGYNDDNPWAFYLELLEFVCRASEYMVSDMYSAVKQTSPWGQ